MLVVKSITTQNGIVTGVDTVDPETFMATVDQGAAGTSPWLVTGTVDAAQSGVWSVGVTSLPALPAGSNTIGKIDQGAPGAAAWPVSLAGSVAVTGTFWQTTQPVSATALPLPAGAATETTLGGVLKEGTDVTGAVMPAGGGSARGWLSAIWKALTDRLPAALTGMGNLKVSLAESTVSQAVTGTFWQATQPVTGSVQIEQIPGSPSLFVQPGTTWPVTQAGTWTVTGAGGTFPVTGTFWQAVQPVSIAATVAVDTELPAAVTLTDATATPTAPLIGACELLFNGTTWDMRRGMVSGTGLPSGAHTSSQSFTITNVSSRNILVWLNVTAASGTGGLTVQINAADPVSGNLAQLNANPTAVVATGLTVYELGPDASGTASGGITQSTKRTLPRALTIGVAHGNASSYTYSVGYTLLP